MKKHINNLVLAVSLLFTLSSCEKVVGEGPVVTETRSNTNFDEVSLSLPGRLEVQQGTAFKIELSAQRNVLDKIRTQQNGSELVFKFENDVRIKSHEEITVKVTLPELEALSVSGSGNARAYGSFEGSSLRLRISGSGNLEVDEAVYNSIDATISGSGNIRVKDGSANVSDLRISGSGSLFMEDVPVKDVHTTTSGSGNMRVWAENKLDATISGSGSVQYRGTPIVDTRISGSGRVSRIN